MKIIKFLNLKVDGLIKIRDILTTPGPFQKEVKEIVRPRNFVNMSEKELEDYVRQYQQSTWHYSGTCRMGRVNEELVVCSPDGLVKNVSNLRISDASLMPVVVAGNTNATTMMMGRKIGTIAAQNYLFNFGTPASAKL